MYQVKIECAGKVIVLTYKINEGFGEPEFGDGSFGGTTATTGSK